MSAAGKKFANISLWTVLLLFVIRCVIGWNELFAANEVVNVLKCSYTLFGYAGEATGLTAILMWIFNNWLWKWKPINFITGKMPILSSKYSGKITFEWKDEIQERDALLDIEQKFLSVNIKLRTNESHSQAICASIEEVHNEQQLICVYINEPRAELQDRSAIHYGTVMLQIDDKNLKGNYYTMRLTRGSMNFKPI